MSNNSSSSNYGMCPNSYTVHNLSTVSNPNIISNDYIFFSNSLLIHRYIKPFIAVHICTHMYIVGNHAIITYDYSSMF